jgi:hypothetical protein
MFISAARAIIFIVIQRRAEAAIKQSGTTVPSAHYMHELDLFASEIPSLAITSCPRLKSLMRGFLKLRTVNLPSARLQLLVRRSRLASWTKTIVALHRAAHLARAHPDARVLLTTFSDTLANALRKKLKRLLSSEPRLAERIDVYSLNAIGLHFTRRTLRLLWLPAGRSCASY